jgi:hypothetical protein
LISHSEKQALRLQVEGFDGGSEWIGNDPLDAFPADARSFLALWAERSRETATSGAA